MVRAPEGISKEESMLLSYLRDGAKRSMEDICKALGIDQSAAASYVEGMEKLGAISIQRSKQYDIQLTEEGKRDIQEGFPEERLIGSIAKSNGLKISGSIDSIALGWARKNGWVTVENGSLKLTDSGKSAVGKAYPYNELLSRLEKGIGSTLIEKLVKEDKNKIDELSKRGLVTIKERNQISSISITDEGRKLLGSKPEEMITSLSRDIIKSGAWKGSKFKSYDVSDPTERAYPARMHPSHRFFNYIRSVFSGMGFSEVEGPIINNAFWNFDALFSPQDHPTRDMQDTFFLSNPKEIDISDLEVLGRVRRMHKKGWKGAWKESLAKQALLRTHNTVVSVKNILKYGNLDSSVYPVKLFSLGKVFRNESIDYKHLNELNQLDGIIIGNSLTLSNLIFTMREFYSYLGIDVKFKPSYFPFVEPGMEGYYYNKEHNDNIELFGGGIIRKEITKAMGTNKTVLAWGMGLDRMMFDYVETSSLSEIYRNQVGWLRSFRYKKSM
ncbi:MAG: phenylalanine--tRNA ligase subunit alpha [Candidatus Marsarchaeota archaeon]|nr:phenylalanine--tRNA ligase subunit alpha [Candidatus Marsarchaeota archaeon]